MSVQVVNDVRNQKRHMRRKDAEHYVKGGRAEWIGSDQIRLILSHPENIAAAARARAWEADYRPSFDGEPGRKRGLIADYQRITEALRLFGVNPLAAVDRPRSHRQKPKTRVDHLIAPTIDAHQNQVHRLFMEGARESYRKAEDARNARRLKE